MFTDVCDKKATASHEDHEITIMSGSKLEFFLGDRPWFWAKEDEWPLLLGPLSSLRVLRKILEFCICFVSFVRKGQEIIFDDVLKWWKGHKDKI